MGTLYQNGSYVKKDLKKAFELYTKAAKLGEPRAISNLGFMYFNGNYVKRDQPKAVELWREAAEKNLSWAQYYYAWAVYRGCGIEKNVSEAIKWYEKASVEDTNAMYELGIIYMHGKDVPFDECKGMRLLEQAGLNGNSDAASFISTYLLVKKQLDNITTNRQSTSFDEIVNFVNFRSDEDIESAVFQIVFSADGLIGENVLNLSVYKLILSIVQYLYYEASEEEQNISMLLNLIEAGLKINEDFGESDLDRIYNVLEEKEPAHIALKTYSEYKILSNIFARDVFAVCKERFGCCETTETEVKLQNIEKKHKSEIIGAEAKNQPLIARIAVLSCFVLISVLPFVYFSIDNDGIMNFIKDFTRLIFAEMHTAFSITVGVIIGISLIVALSEGYEEATDGITDGFSFFGSCLFTIYSSFLMSYFIKKHISPLLLANLIEEKESMERGSLFSGIYEFTDMFDFKNDAINLISKYAPYVVMITAIILSFISVIKVYKRNYSFIALLKCVGMSLVWLIVSVAVTATLGFIIWGIAWLIHTIVAGIMFGLLLIGLFMFLPGAVSRGGSSFGKQFSNTYTHSKFDSNGDYLSSWTDNNPFS